MKLITAYVQPFKLEEVTRALQSLPQFPGLSVTNVRGFGQRKAAHEEHGAREDLLDFADKAKLETVVSDELVAEIGDAIREAAHTGNRGDGKVFVLDVESAVRIRTGETEELALWSPFGDPEADR